MELKANANADTFRFKICSFQPSAVYGIRAALFSGVLGQIIFEGHKLINTNSFSSEISNKLDTFILTNNIGNVSVSYCYCNKLSQTQ